MCSLIGSLDKGRLKALVKLNEYRGNRTSSVSSLDLDTFEIKVTRFDQPLVDEAIENHFKDGFYNIIHMQAPTGPTSGIHPAESHSLARGQGFLWHNGLILGHQGDWDTQAILDGLMGHDGYESLNSLRGSFACMFAVNGKSFSIFRNAISPLFIADNGDISSTEFEGSEKIDCDVIYDLLPFESCIKFMKSVEFETAHNPYDI